MKRHVTILVLCTLIVMPAQAIAANKAKPAKLMCFNPTTAEYRRSDVVSGCTKSEASLGAMVVRFPAQRPKDLNPYLRVRFQAAQSEAKRDGVSLSITSGYRTYERQAWLFARAVKRYGSEAAASRWVLPPELSHHTWGMALDINYPKNPESTKWLARNGYKYGLCRAYQNEWWHFEPLTVPGVRCPASLTNASSTKIN